MNKYKEYVSVWVGIKMPGDDGRGHKYTEFIAVPDDPAQREQAWIDFIQEVPEVLGPLLRRTLERAATGKAKEGPPIDMNIDLRIVNALTHYEKERIVPNGEEFARRAEFADLRGLNKFLKRRKGWSWKDLRDRLTQAIETGP